MRDTGKRLERIGLAAGAAVGVDEHGIELVSAQAGGEHALRLSGSADLTDTRQDEEGLGLCAIGRRAGKLLRGAKPTPHVHPNLLDIGACPEADGRACQKREGGIAARKPLAHFLVTWLPAPLPLVPTQARHDAGGHRCDLHHQGVSLGVVIKLIFQAIRQAQALAPPRERHANVKVSRSGRSRLGMHGIAAQVRIGRGKGMVGAPCVELGSLSGTHRLQLLRTVGPLHAHETIEQAFGLQQHASPLGVYLRGVEDDIERVRVLRRAHHLDLRGRRRRVYRTRSGPEHREAGDSAGSKGTADHGGDVLHHLACLGSVSGRLGRKRPQEGHSGRHDSILRTRGLTQRSRIDAVKARLAQGLRCIGHQARHEHARAALSLVVHVDDALRRLKHVGGAQLAKRIAHAQARQGVSSVVRELPEHEKGHGSGRAQREPRGIAAQVHPRARKRDASRGFHKLTGAKSRGLLLGDLHASRTLAVRIALELHVGRARGRHRHRLAGGEHAAELVDKRQDAHAARMAGGQDARQAAHRLGVDRGVAACGKRHEPGGAGGGQGNSLGDEAIAHTLGRARRRGDLLHLGAFRQLI